MEFLRCFQSKRKDLWEIIVNCGNTTQTVLKSVYSILSLIGNYKPTVCNNFWTDDGINIFQLKYLNIWKINIWRLLINIQNHKTPPADADGVSFCYNHIERKIIWQIKINRPLIRYKFHFRSNSLIFLA